MSEIDKYEAQKKKLDGLCEEHDLTYRFFKDGYPIRMTIRPIQGAGVQLSMLEESEGEDYISPDASMTWIFEDGELSSKVSGGTFTISKVLRSKIENILLKMIAYWQQYFFRDVIENESLRKGTMPVIDEDDAKDTDEDPEEEAVVTGEDDGIVDDAEDDGKTPDEDTIQAATLLVRMENKASISLLQRRLKIGYAMAARVMDALEANGVVGPYDGSNPREVLAADVPEEVSADE